MTGTFDMLAVGPVIVVALVAAMRKQIPQIDGPWTILVATVVGQLVALAATLYTGEPLAKAPPIGLLITGIAVGGDSWIQKVTQNAGQGS